MLDSAEPLSGPDGDDKKRKTTTRKTSMHALAVFSELRHGSLRECRKRPHHRIIPTTRKRCSGFGIYITLENQTGIPSHRQTPHDAVVILFRGMYSATGLGYSPFLRSYRFEGENDSRAPQNLLRKPWNG